MKDLLEAKHKEYERDLALLRELETHNQELRAQNQQTTDDKNQVFDWLSIKTF